MANQYGWNRYERNEGFQTRRQKEAARQRKLKMEEEAKAAYSPDWGNAKEWRLVNGDYVPFKDLATQAVWSTVNWLLRNTQLLFRQTEEYRQLGLKGDAYDMAINWLKQQPAAYALLREACLRDISFPTDVFQCIRDWKELKTITPWADPALQAEQADGRRAFLLEPPPGAILHRQRRFLDLSLE